MAHPDKPKQIDWASNSTYASGEGSGNSTKVEPSASVKTYGYNWGDQLPAPQFNWVMNNITSWIDFLQYSPFANWTSDAGYANSASDGFYGIATSGDYIVAAGADASGTDSELRYGRSLELPSLWAAVTLTSTELIYGCAYDPLSDGWVAFGNNGFLAVRDDPDPSGAWSEVTPGSGNNYVAFGSLIGASSTHYGIFAIGNGSGNVTVSSDSTVPYSLGASLGVVSTGLGANILGVGSDYVNNNAVMAVGAGGSVALFDSSFDGTAGTISDVSVSAASGESFWCAAYHPHLSRWVVAGTNGAIYYTDDNGSTWTAAASKDGLTTGDLIKAMVSCNGMLVATFADADGTNIAGYALSVDGSTWKVFRDRFANCYETTNQTTGGNWGMDYHHKHGVLFVGGQDEIHRSNKW